MFIKYEAEVSSRVGGDERGVVDFGKCLLRPMSRNSVLEEFRVRRFVFAFTALTTQIQLKNIISTNSSTLIARHFIQCFIHLNIMFQKEKLNRE